MKKYFLIGLAFILTFPLVVKASGDGVIFMRGKGMPSNGLVGYWPIDEGTGQTLTDSSITENDMMLGSTTGADANDPTWTTGYLIFDGVNDYCIIKKDDTEQGNVSINVNNGSAALTDDGQDFTPYIRSNSNNSYIAAVYDEESEVAFGYCGDLNGAATSIKLYSTKTGTTQNLTAKDAAFDTGDTLTYYIRKSDLHTLTAITAGLWIKAVKHADTVGPILGKYQPGNNHRSWEIYYANAADNAITIYLSDDGVVSKIYVPSITCVDNTWHFIMFTFESNTLNIYIDNVLDSNPTKTQDDAMTALYDTFVPVAIDFFTATASYSKNNIAQVFVYNRVLGSGERTKVYNYTRNELVKAGVL